MKKTTIAALLILLMGASTLVNCAGVFQKRIEGSWAVKNIQGWGEGILPMAGEIVEFDDGIIKSSNEFLNFLLILLGAGAATEIPIRYKNINNRNMIIYIDPFESFNLEVEVSYMDRNKVMRLDYDGSFIELTKNNPRNNR